MVDEYSDDNESNYVEDSTKEEEDELYKGRYTEDQRKATEAQDEHKQKYKEKTSDHSKEGRQPEQEYEFSGNYEKSKKKSLFFILKVLKSLRAALLRVLFRFSKKNEDIEEHLLRAGGGKANSKMLLHSLNNEKDLAKKIILVYLLFLRKQMMASVLRKLTVQESQLHDYVSARIKDNVRNLQDVSSSENLKLTQNVIQLAEKDLIVKSTAQAQNMLEFRVVILSVQQRHNMCFPIQHPEHNTFISVNFTLNLANTVADRASKGIKEIINSLEVQLALAAKLGKETANLIVMSIPLNAILCEQVCKIQEKSPQALKNQGTCEVKINVTLNESIQVLKVPKGEVKQPEAQKVVPKETVCDIH